MLPRLLWWSSLLYHTSKSSCRSVEERNLIWPNCLNIPNNCNYSFKVISSVQRYCELFIFQEKGKFFWFPGFDRSESFFAQHQRSVHWLYGAPSSPYPGWRDRAPTVDAVLDLCAQFYPLFRMTNISAAIHKLFVGLLDGCWSWTNIVVTC